MKIPFENSFDKLISWVVPVINWFGIQAKEKRLEYKIRLTFLWPSENPGSFPYPGSSRVNYTWYAGKDYKYKILGGHFLL